MPIQNGSDSFNVGRDVRLKVIGPDGDLDIQHVMNFDQKPEYADLKVDPISGKPMFGSLEKGWTGSFEVTRSNRALDRFFDDSAKRWHNNGIYQASTVYAFISESDGSTTTLAFTNCALKFDDAGNYSGDKEVRQKVSFMASTREVR